MRERYVLSLFLLHNRPPIFSTPQGVILEKQKCNDDTTKANEESMRMRDSQILQYNGPFKHVIFGNIIYDNIVYVSRSFFYHKLRNRKYNNEIKINTIKMYNSNNE